MITQQNIAVSDLKPHEHIIESHVDEIFDQIKESMQILNPILIDSKTKVILDGHHRYTAAKKLLLKRIPCVCVDYLNDEIIAVYPRRENSAISKKMVIAAALQGKAMPHKSTRHEIKVVFETQPTPLYKLQ